MKTKAGGVAVDDSALMLEAYEQRGCDPPPFHPYSAGVRSSVRRSATGGRALEQPEPGRARRPGQCRSSTAAHLQPDEEGVLLERSGEVAQVGHNALHLEGLRHLRGREEPCPRDRWGSINPTGGGRGGSGGNASGLRSAGLQGGDGNISRHD